MWIGHLNNITSKDFDVQIVPQNITIGILVSIVKEPFMESEKSN